MIAGFLKTTHVMMRRSRAAVLSTVCATMMAACGIDIAEPDKNHSSSMLIFGGPIYTGKGNPQTVEAVVIHDDTIVYAGTRSGAADFVDEDTLRLDLDKNTAFPGWTDAHAHIHNIGLREMELTLEDIESIDALTKRIEQRLQGMPPGETLVGRGWIETHWPEGRMPTRWDIDAVSPNNPVYLVRSDGHAALVNSAALDATQITAATNAPSGGEISRNDQGEATGILIDNAMRLASELLPKQSSARIEAALEKGAQISAANCWTGVHNMSASPAHIPILEKLAAEDRLPIRLYNSVDRQDHREAMDLVAERLDDERYGHMTTRAIKLYADGALGSRGAALFEPYADAPDSRGLMLLTKEEAMPILIEALRRGIQVHSHAIGPRANRAVLDWYEEAFATVPPRDRRVADPRWRIEHAQIIAADDLPRFAGLGVIASMQPSHAIGDLHFAPSRLGIDRLDGAYAWRSLIENGATIAAGSDAPVEKGDPAIEFYAAVARKDLNGCSGDGWHPEEAVDRLTALKMFTLWPAYASFQESLLGSIEAGKRADLSVFSTDLMTADEDALPQAQCVMTIADGRIVFDPDGLTKGK